MNVQDVDLNLLRTLDVLLREQNVTRAAERLFVTQQAVSGALQRLRQHFGDELLTRVGRHLEPTPARLIVLRMLTNLRASYERRADRVGLALVARMRAAIPELGDGAAAEALRLGAVFN